VKEIKEHLVQIWQQVKKSQEIPLESELAGSVEECDEWLNSLPFGRVIGRVEISTTTGSQPILYLKIDIAHLWSIARVVEKTKFSDEADVRAYFDGAVDSLSIVSGIADDFERALEKETDGLEDLVRLNGSPGHSMGPTKTVRTWSGR
jgi:hypothetical protein